MPSFMLNDNPMDASPLSDVPSSPQPAKSTPKRKRPASPPHEEVLADNQDIAVSSWRVEHVPIARFSYNPSLSIAVRG